MHGEVTNSSNPRFIVVSNRGPVEHHFGPDNHVQARRASGGVVTALSAVRKYQDFSWIANAITPADRFVARASARRRNLIVPEMSLDQVGKTGTSDEWSEKVDFVVVSQDVFHNHYEIFSNRILWFLQHSMWNTLQAPKDKKTIGEAWWNGYVPANIAFARAVKAAVKAQERPVVMLHDYHLYLAPGLIREYAPRAILQHFVHIPWPAPEVWGPLPASVRREICRGLLANDIVGFQTTTSVRSFLSCCEEFIEDAEVDYGSRIVRFDNRSVLVRNYPISVDVAELRRAMDSAAVRQHQERLRPLCGVRTIVRVDRLEPSKNIAAGFRAFERLLEIRPDLMGDVRFLAFLVPSRTAVPEYQQCYRDVMGIVEAINARFGRDGFRPIEVLYENNYEQALAGMSLGDVTLVNPLADGMNLIAKESPIVSARDSVLVLSKTAGAFEQLRRGALDVEPTDVEATALALGRALEMLPEERRERIGSLRARIEKEDVVWWIKSQLRDIGYVLLQERERSDRRRRRHFSSDHIPVKGARSVITCRIPAKK